MTKLFFIIALLFTTSLYAAETSNHREHGAHVHGSAELAIAFDNTNGTIDFKSPSESIFGFEHEAKTAVDKKALTDGLNRIERNIDQMVRFQPSLKCQIQKNKIEVLFEGKNHSNTSASFSVKCEKPLLGSNLSFYFQKIFPQLKDLDVQIVIDNLQKSLEIKSDGTELELK